jgi:antirestriction protein ArdC
MKTTKKANRQTVYDQITEQILSGIEKDGLKWFKAWTDKGTSSFPVNRARKTQYNGINIFLLNNAMLTNGFKVNEWLTFKEAADLGGSVKGQKSTGLAVRWLVSYKNDITGKWYPSLHHALDAGEDQSDLRKCWALKKFYLFNVEQVDGVDPLTKPDLTTVENPFKNIKIADDVYKNYKDRPSLSHGGNQAYYSPSKHHVQMPEQSQFKVNSDYYAVLFHELVHSTGHSKILSRSGVTQSTGFGSHEYSKEELIAEIGAAFLCGITGVEPSKKDNSTAYIKSWLQVLRNNKKWVVLASTQAIKAVERMM